MAAPACDLPASLRGQPHDGCTVACVEFDFARKVEREVPLDRICESVAERLFVWIDVYVTEPEDAAGVLESLTLIDPEVVAQALTGEPATQLARYDDYIHLVVSGCRVNSLQFELDRVDVVIGENFLLTIHKGTPSFLQAMKRDYRADFVRFAKSPSFLLYEIWDHLIENYLAVQKKFEERVEQLQSALIGTVDDKVFAAVSELGADLLRFRKVLLPARAALTELSSRKSIFISEATQPFLANMVGTLERVLHDLLVDRDILSESLNLHMSIVGHRTNRVMSRLTVVSIIFLPLTFLCGVYGMNFEVLPETKWEHGYLFFWITALTIVLLLVTLMRRNKLL